ncbi:ABC transporter substrate-binding protein [Thalassotalea insulae]|uniref:ABC transporter substrate-binding protein n=1 Tax=Thalassotalea insulae TaxID=2056778 RepID=A0ABQ6GVJ1_9GAMM|nr:transporter substrate-binding domain-containing protein [Thalassotalea insulae]GLX79709.1 ABC transporter substrate-binding protein [Thalassotalea insulae]
MIVIKLTKVFTVWLFIISLHIFNHSYAQQLNFASIKLLSEQQVAKIVLPQIYQKLGKTITVTPLPANRAQQEANSGVKDGEILRIFNYGIETPHVIRVPTPYYYLTTAAFTQEKNEITVKQLADLSPYRVGIVRGVKHTNYATKGFPRVYLSNNSEQLFRQLAQGNIDIALTNYRNGIYTINKLNLQAIKVLDKELTYEPLYHYINKKHADMVEPVNQMIRQLTTSGELEQMIKHAENQIY